MRIVTSFFEFEEEVKTIDSWWRLRDMGLTSRLSVTGSFDPSEVDELKNLCEHHPELHIVSYCTNGFAWNCYHPDGDTFYLAEGNPDPNILLDWRVESDDLWDEWCKNGLSLPEPGE